MNISSKLSDIKESIYDSIDSIADETKEALLGGLIMATVLGGSCYYCRGQELHDVTVSSFERNMGYCGEYGEVDCYNPVHTFSGVEGCFEDKSLNGCYNFEEGEKLIMQPGDKMKTVTYRNPVLPPWGCDVITEVDPSKEEMAGKGRWRDKILCLFR